MKPTTHAIYPRPVLHGALSSATDTDRIFRFIERLGGWQCPSCHELFPEPKLGIDGILHGRILGVCPDCFLNNEDVTDVLEMPKTDWDIYAIRNTIYREGSVFSYLAPYHGFVNSNFRKIPLSFAILATLDSIIGIDRIAEITAKFGTAGQKTFDSTATRWNPELGLVPIAINEFPPLEDTKAWKEIWKAHPVFIECNPQPVTA